MIETLDTIEVSTLAHPLSTERTLATLEHGPTLADLIRIAGIPPWCEVRAYVDGDLVYPAFYRMVRPKRGSHVLLRAVPKGGSGSSGKNIGLIVAGIVLIVVGVVLSALGVTIVPGGALISVGISLVLSGVLNILIPPPTPPKLRPLSGLGASDQESPTLSISGQRNDARPYAPLPRIFGRHRIFPPYAALPFTEIVGADQYLRLLFWVGLGVTTISDLKIGETPIENFTDVELGIRTGATGEPPLSIYTNDVTEDPLSVALTFAGGGQIRTSRANAAELSVDIAFPQGLVVFDAAGGKAPMTVTVTVEYRPTGGTTFVSAPGSPITTTDARQALVRDGLRWKPQQAVTTTPGSSWDQLGLGSFDANKVNDNVLNVTAFAIDASPAGSWLKFDSGVGLANEFGRVEVTTAAAGAADNGLWDVQWSDDAIEWTTVYEGFHTGLTSPLSAAWQAPGAHRYWRLLKTNGAVVGPSYYEVAWWRSTAGQYDVRLTRTTPDSVSLNQLDVTVWSALRSVGISPPITMPAGVAYAVVEMRIKATDQLNGVIDNFNCIAEAEHLDYATYPSTVLVDDPLGYWRLGEVAGATVAFDATGQARHGAYRGLPTLGVAGLLTNDPDTCMQIGADDAWVDTFEGLAAINMGGGDFSVELLIQPGTIAAGTEMIVQKAAGDPFQTGIVGWGLRRSGAALHAVRNSGGAVAPTVTVASTTLVASTTYHVMVRYSKASGLLLIEVNGTTTGTANVGTASYDDTYGLIIGRQSPPSVRVSISASDSVAPGLGDVGTVKIDPVLKTASDTAAVALSDVGGTPVVTVIVQIRSSDTLAPKLSDVGALGTAFTGKLDEVSLYAALLSDARRDAHYAASTGTREWLTQATSNPASHYRAVLQDLGNYKAVADARLDLAAIQAWHQENSSGGRSSNIVVDYKTTIFELLKVIAACGRATPTMNDGKYATVRDLTQTVPAQHFTPRNSRGFRGRRVMLDTVHALKVRFIDPSGGWQQSERIVYDDGYSADGLTPGTVAASRFEVLETHGVTDPDLAFKLGRYHLAVARLRPEFYEIETDVEALACRRGDLVKVVHDVPEWGVSVGRIKSVTTNAGNATAITVDEKFPMSGATSYAVRVRLSDGTSVVAQVVTVAGEQTSLTFTTPVAPPLPAVGDLVLFGVLNAESVSAIVSRIEPGPELSARLTLVDDAPGVRAADQVPIPAWDPQMTRPTLNELLPPTPVVDSVVSDETVLLRALDGSLQSRIVVSLHYLATSNVRADYVETRWRRSGSVLPFDVLPTLAADVTTVSIVGVEDGVAYDVRIRSVNRDGPTSPWAEVLGHVVVGKSTPPVAPTNLRLEEDGALRWDYDAPPPDLDGFEVRRSPGATGNWMTAIEMHVGIVSASPFFLPTIYGEWTFLVAAVDTSGNASDPAELTIDFGDVRLRNQVATFDYDGAGYPGTITNGTVSAGDLKADQVTTGFWAQDGNLFWSASGLTLFWGGTYKEMTYLFTYTTGANAAGTTLFFDTTVVAVAWSLEYRVGASGDYLPFPGALTDVLPSQEYDFRLITAAGVVQGVVSRLTLYLDAPDIVEDHANFATAVTTGSRLTLTNTFRAIKQVEATVIASGGETAITAKVLDQQNTAGAGNGPLIASYDAAGAIVAGHVNAVIKGF